MASPVYSTALLWGNENAAVSVDPGYVYVVRDISGVINNAGLAAPALISFLAGEFPFFDVFAVAFEYKNFHWEGRLVLAEAPGLAELTATLGGDAATSYVVSGYILTLP